MEINFISIYDNTAEAKYLFVSESVTDILGYQPEELVGKGGYSILHPDEVQAISIVHRGNVKNERMSSVNTYRNRHKDGHYVLCDVVVHYCYDVLICTNFAVTTNDCFRHKIRINSAEDVFVIQPDGSIQLAGAWNLSQEKMKRLLAEGNPWDANMNVISPQEPRFCLFLNRYTSLSIIVFATQMCQNLVGSSQMELIGESLYDYVDDKDRLNVERLITLAKSNDLINRIRFNWKRRDNDELEYLEAVISCTYDGLVFVARRCGYRMQ
ncbi:uncharacterized protein ATC70_009886 [Mucor velutinosus]|uniref:PAS domain-containing protein n=1 Tax=Mucor velutinosus TaxID=708070 RepID=A0AAN7HPM4_9FUNG|nr:hypothetical protein ATC70_009886 [Mucor velutinosus]